MMSAIRFKPSREDRVMMTPRYPFCWWCSSAFGTYGQLRSAAVIVDGHLRYVHAGCAAPAEASDWK